MGWLGIYYSWHVVCRFYKLFTSLCCVFFFCTSSSSTIHMKRFVLLNIQVDQVTRSVGRSVNELKWNIYIRREESPKAKLKLYSIKSTWKGSDLLFMEFFPFASITFKIFSFFQFLVTRCLNVINALSLLLCVFIFFLLYFQYSLLVNVYYSLKWSERLAKFITCAKRIFKFMNWRFYFKIYAMRCFCDAVKLKDSSTLLSCWLINGKFEKKISYLFVVFYVFFFKFARHSTGIHTTNISKSSNLMLKTIFISFSYLYFLFEALFFMQISLPFK